MRVGGTLPFGSSDFFCNKPLGNNAHEIGTDR